MREGVEVVSLRAKALHQTGHCLILLESINTSHSVKCAIFVAELAGTVVGLVGLTAKCCASGSDLFPDETIVHQRGDLRPDLLAAPLQMSQIETREETEVAGVGVLAYADDVEVALLQRRPLTVAVVPFVR